MFNPAHLENIRNKAIAQQETFADWDSLLLLKELRDDFRSGEDNPYADDFLLAMVTHAMILSKVDVPSVDYLMVHPDLIDHADNYAQMEDDLVHCVEQADLIETFSDIEGMADIVTSAQRYLAERLTDIFIGLLVIIARTEYEQFVQMQSWVTGFVTDEQTGLPSHSL